MSDETTNRPLIDRERLHAEFEQRVAPRRVRPSEAKFTTRTRMRIVHNYVKEAEVGGFTLQCDEAVPMGTGTAPRPLYYFLVGVGF
jgi:hypothetical protein